MITGLYGCMCHPFESWKDLEWYERQKLEIGQRVMIRHTRQIGFVYSQEKDHKGYFVINVLPCSKASDRQLEHVSNIIPESKWAGVQLSLF